MRTFPGILIVLILSTLPLTAQSEEEAKRQEYAYRYPGLVTVEDSELAFTQKEFSATRMDSAYFMCYFNDGWLFATNYFTSKDVLFNRAGLFVLINSPEGKTYWFTKEMEPENIKQEQEYLYVSDGTNTIEGSGQSYNIRYYLDEFSCNLFFENRLNAWKVGDGLTELSEQKEEFDFRIINSPWSDVSGYIKINDKKIRVDGQGYAERSLAVLPFAKTHPLQHYFRVFSPNHLPEQEQWRLSIMNVRMHESYGAKKMARLLLGNGSDWVLVTDHYEFEAKDFVKTQDAPYEYPRKLTLMAQSQGYTLRGTFKTRQLFNVTDVLDEVPAVIKAIILLFIDRPVLYRCRGTFNGKLTYPSGEIVKLELHGIYHYNIVR